MDSLSGPTRALFMFAYDSLEAYGKDQEADKGMADGKAFFAAQGEANMKHAGELAAACIESVQTNLFVVNAKESYVDAGWAKTAPEIYGQP